MGPPAKSCLPLDSMLEDQKKKKSYLVKLWFFGAYSVHLNAILSDTDQWPRKVKNCFEDEKRRLGTTSPATPVIQRCKIEEDPFKRLKRSKKWEKSQKKVKSWS